MIKIPQNILNEICEHGQREAPLEACGYLAGAAGVIARAFPLTNMDRSPDHFSLNPAEQFKAVRTMRAEGLELQAVYHSHPASPARPSAEDLRLAHDPSLSYVIVSLLQKPESVRSFRIIKGAPQEEPLEIPPAAGNAL